MSKTGTPRLQTGNIPKLKLNVTDECIANGVARNSNHCMVAEAVKAARPRLSRVCVDIQTIRATDVERGERYVWLTPRAAQQLIVDFDHGKKPKPFAVTLSSGQVVPMTRTSVSQKAAKRKYNRTRANAKVTEALTSTKATLKKNHHNGGHAVHNINGGNMPPKSIGARRAYGLRSLAV